MKPPRPHKAEDKPPMRVIAKGTNHPDWRERYWRAVCVLLPELREGRPVAEERPKPKRTA